MGQPGYSLVLDFTRAELTADPYAFRAGLQRYILHSPGGGVETATLDWDDALLADLTTLGRPGCDPAIAPRVGSRVGQFLAQTGWRQHEAELAAALERREPVTLTLRSNAAELYALPWELLPLGQSGRPLGELDGVLWRYAWPDTVSAAEIPLLPQSPGRILFAWAGAVPAAAHASAIARACQRAGLDFSPERDVLPMMSGERLLQALRLRDREPISVLHLLCHGVRRGDTFGLKVEADQGPGSGVLDAAWLRRNLAEHAGTVRLIVLCACDGGNSGQLGNHLGSIAQALHRAGFAAVVASRFPLSVTGSIALVDQLYDDLLGNLYSLEAALRRVRGQLLRQPGSLDWAGLTLYARPEDDPGPGEPADSRPLRLRPYRGLFSFYPEHRRFFFGRETEIARILTALAALRDRGRPRLYIVTGASGTGKSSLVLAGVVPRLMAPPWNLRLAVLRPGRDPEAALRRVMARLESDGQPSVLCVDQLEEIFTHISDVVVRGRFVRELWELAKSPERNTLILLTLRVDFVGRCGDILLDDAAEGDGCRFDAIAFNEDHRIFIGQMSLSQVRETIEAPAQLVGLRLEPGLTARMLAEAGREPGALPLLQDALDLLWQRRRGRLLTQNAYEELGGVGGALEGRAERLIANLDEAGQRTARRLLESLVHVGQDPMQLTRRRVRKAEVLPRPGPNEAAEHARFEHVLGELIAARLVVCQGGTEMGQSEELEIAHEALLSHWPRLTAWLSDDRKMLIALEELRDWVAGWQRHGVLLVGTQLGYAEELERRYGSDLSEAARQLIAASRHQAERQRRGARQRRNLLVGALLVLSLVFAAQARVARIARKHAELKQQQAQAATLVADEHRLSAQREARRAHDTLRLGVARAFLSDPTSAAALLREIAHVTAQLMPAVIPTALALVGQRVWMERELQGFSAPLTHLAVTADGRLLASASADRIQVVDLDGQRPPLQLSAEGDLVTCLAFSADGARLAAGTRDGSGRIFALAKPDASATLVAVLRGHTGGLTHVEFSADGHLLLTAAADRSARLWSAERGVPVAVLRPHPAAVSAAALSPDGLWAVTASAGVLRRWSLRGPTPTTILRAGNREVLFVAFSPDGTELAASYGGPPGLVELIPLRGAGGTIALAGHRQPVRFLSFHRDGRLIVTASEDGLARVFDQRALAVPTVLSGHHAGVTYARFIGAADRVVTAAADDTVRIWTMGGPAVPRIFSPPGPTADQPGGLLAAALSPDGRRLTLALRDGSLRVQSLDGAGEPLILRGHRGAVLSVTFSPDGRQLLSTGADGQALLQAAHGQGPPQLLGSPQAKSGAAAFSPDGRQIALGGLDGQVRIRRSDGTGGVVCLPVHRAAISSVSFSPDGGFILTSSLDGTARILRQPLLGVEPDVVLSGHRQAVRSAAFSPDGQRVVTASDDRTARLWTRGGRLLRTLSAHDGGVRAALFDPSGEWVATAAADGNVRLFGPYVLPAIWSGHQGAVRSLQFSVDGKQLLSIGTDGTAWLRPLTFDWPALRRQLWLSTPFCFSVVTRRLLPDSSAAGAGREQAACESMVRCLQGSGPPYEQCLAALSRLAGEL